MGDQNIRYLVTSLLILLSTSLFSQSIPIQLMVVDQNGFEKANHSVKLRLTLTNDTSSSTGQYQEVHLTTTNDFGIVSAALGNGITTTVSSYLTFSLFPFTELEPFIKVELDTSLTSSQYFVAGTIKYSYPPIARRALVSDSSQISSQSYESYHSLKSDTADYIKNNLIYELNNAAHFNINSGIAIPALDSTVMNSIVTPVVGQVIYNSQSDKLLIWSLNSWQPISVGAVISDDLKRIRNAIIIN